MDPSLVKAKDTTSYWVLTLPYFLAFENYGVFHCFLLFLLAFLSLSLLTWAFSSAGTAWRNGRNRQGRVPIPGLRGLPFLGSLLTLTYDLPHRTLAAIAASRHDSHLMAFSLGSSPVVVASHPITAKEILTSPHFADRPLKQSAKSLMFGRAIGFAPNGTYWRLLRRIASSHLFSPKRIAAHEGARQLECAAMIHSIHHEQIVHGGVCLRNHLQAASLNNVMWSVFGKRFEEGDLELEMVRDLVREGFELLGAFNWSDYLPWLTWFYDPFRINQRCAKLVPKVNKFVQGVIDEHRRCKTLSDDSDFVDVLLSLDGDEKLDDDDMVAVLWEMIFRGTDTTALLTEWVMAELVLHGEIQEEVAKEIDRAVGGDGRNLTDADVAKLPYLQAVVKETLRLHPPGPLLSWARLSSSDVQLSNGMLIPENTTAMVNMWAITHDPHVWEEPHVFNPGRFLKADLDIRGGDLRLAPFGAGRRVCPGKNLGLVTVTLWVAKLVHHFKWAPDPAHPVDLTELLKLSCEMKNPLRAVAAQRRGL
ncbi:cytochrome P450 78A7 [Benincasa hispida]|uniref:cytochrome P450 78A7 n=1 Tax=Benincasa hispida TaxID=102211 RepID=UPI001901D1C9|nr:cytochrome P450 78A7 [Benincasa hispida]